LNKEVSGICKCITLFSTTPVINVFLQDCRNSELFHLAIHGDHQALIRLETCFQKYFFKIRFIKYISSIVKNCTFDYNRRKYFYEKRHALILDKSLAGDTETTLIECIPSNDLSFFDGSAHTPEDLYNSIDNDQLADAFHSLKIRQKLIIFYKYSTSYKDIEIARLLNICHRRDIIDPPAPE